MPERQASPLACAPMYLDDRISDGYVVIRTRDGLDHSFVVRGLGPSASVQSAAALHWQQSYSTPTMSGGVACSALKPCSSDVFQRHRFDEIACVVLRAIDALPHRVRPS